MDSSRSYKVSQTLRSLNSMLFQWAPARTGHTRNIAGTTILINNRPACTHPATRFHSVLRFHGDNRGDYRCDNRYVCLRPNRPVTGAEAEAIMCEMRDYCRMESSHNLESSALVRPELNILVSFLYSTH